MDRAAESYRRFLQGDDRAFDEIMAELFHRLVFFIDTYVHDVAAAEDIAMDVFSELIVHRHRFNFKVTLKTYLFMLGRSRALDCLRHRKVLDITELSEADRPGDEYELEEFVLADEEKRRVHTAVEQLHEPMRTAVHLVYFEDMTYAQAAKVMNKNLKQVDNLLYRAKKELHVLLGKEEENNA